MAGIALVLLYKDRYSIRIDLTFQQYPDRYLLQVGGHFGRVCFDIREVVLVYAIKQRKKFVHTSSSVVFFVDLTHTLEKLRKTSPSVVGVIKTPHVFLYRQHHCSQRRRRQPFP